MSPEKPAKIKGSARDNLYTLLLAAALGVVLATAIFVACKCYFQYDAIFTVPK